jgi:hypothetical protein
MNIQRLCWRRSLGQSLLLNSVCLPCPQNANCADGGTPQRRQLSDQPRGLLELPQLLDPNDAPLVENGIPGLYQPFGFKAAWTEWQGHMVNELNKRIAGR